MSKLLDKLDRSDRGNVAPLGFGPAATRERLPSILFVGALLKNHGEGAKLLATGGADAALVRAATLDASEVRTAKEALGDIPWGLWVDRLEGDKVEAAREQGCDFLVFEVEQAPVEALHEGEVARILVVRPDMEERLLRTLEDLPVDAFLMRWAESPPSAPLQRLMLIGVVRGMVSKYLFVECLGLPTPQEVEAFRDAGVDGVLVDVASITAEELSRFRSQTLNLPRKKARGERITPTIPRLGTGLRPRREEEEDEEEDEY